MNEGFDVIVDHYLWRIIYQGKELLLYLAQVQIDDILSL